MDEDHLMFSGELPENDVTQQLLSETLLSNDDDISENLTNIIFNGTTLAPFSPYHPNFYHLTGLITKCILSLLVLVLSTTLKRDFLKIFVLFLLVPIILECGFDIYTEIKMSVTVFGVRELEWIYYRGDHYTGTSNELQHDILGIFEEVLTRYTTYNIYKEVFYFTLVCFILSDLLFWSFLFSSIVAFYYAHKAVVRPEEINYIPYFWSFFKIQLFPVLFTFIEVLISLFEVPVYIYLGVTAIIRISACLVVFTIITQILASLIVFCRHRDEYTKSSPYDQVREGKWRLFWLIILQLTVNVLSVPYIAWATISLAQDFLLIFGFSGELVQDVPLHLATDTFVLHVTVFLIRPIFLLISIVAFLVPHRKKFNKFFCPFSLRK